MNCLIAGTHPKTGVPELYWLDYLAACQKVPFAAHGYASYFCLSIMDRFYKPGLSIPETVAILKKCIHELQKRFVGQVPGFLVKIIDKDGIREIQI